MGRMSDPIVTPVRTQAIAARAKQRNEKLMTKKKIIAHYLKQIASGSQSNQQQQQQQPKTSNSLVAVPPLFSIPEYIFCFSGAEEEDEVTIGTVVTENQEDDCVSTSLASGRLNAKQDGKEVPLPPVPSFEEDGIRVFSSPPTMPKGGVEILFMTAILESTSEEASEEEEAEVVPASESSSPTKEILVTPQPRTGGRVYVAAAAALVLCLVAAAVYSHPTIKVVLLGQVHEPSIKRSRRRPERKRGLPNEFRAFFVPVNGGDNKRVSNFFAYNKWSSGVNE